MTPSLFLREVEVLVGPLTAAEGGGDPIQALRFHSDGTPGQLRIAFNVTKHLVSTANPTSVRIYNLRADTRAALQQQGAQMRLLAGWKSTGMVEIFKGGLFSAVTTREGADLVTSLSGLPLYGSAEGVVKANSYQMGETLKRAVIDLARSIPGVSVDELDVRVPDVTFGSQGWSFAGSAAEGLNILARIYSFTWRITGSSFHAEQDGLPGSRIHVLDSASGYLLRAEPSMAFTLNNGISRFAATGITISSFLFPWLEPGHRVDLRSTVNPWLNGIYDAHVVSHNGDTFGQQWDTRVETLYSGGFTFGGFNGS